MKTESRRIYNAYLGRVASLNAVGSTDVDKTFNVVPSVQQKLENKMQESSDFLKRINLVPVDEKSGAKLGLGLSGPSAGRTNTANKERQTRDLTTLSEIGYQCVQTNYDTHLGYEKIDAWAKFPDFQNRVAMQLVIRQALDRICIGFNGLSAAADTDIAANPLLQDVNKGWLQHLREDAPGRVLASGDVEAGKVVIGVGGDYKNIDAAVFDAIQLLDPWHRQNPNLVAILGSALMHDKYFPLVNVTQAPSETLASQVVISQKRVGGLQAVTVPFFPANAVLVTTFDNLSVYWQSGARRRHIIENPRRNRVENFESSNDAFVLEDNGLAALVEKIEIAE